MSKIEKFAKEELGITLKSWQVNKLEEMLKDDNAHEVSLTEPRGSGKTLTKFVFILYIIKNYNDVFTHKKNTILFLEETHIHMKNRLVEFKELLDSKNIFYNLNASTSTFSFENKNLEVKFDLSSKRRMEGFSVPYLFFPINSVWKDWEVLRLLKTSMPATFPELPWKIIYE